MNEKAKQPKKLRHKWAPRPDCTFLSYCTACGVYEDEITLTKQTRSSLEISNVKVFRPYKRPRARFEGRAQPQCIPLENGPAEAPPPRVDRMGKAIENALKAAE